MQIYRFLLLCIIGGIVSYNSNAQTKNYLYSKGYKPDIQVGYMFEGNQPTYSLSSSHGYSFGNGLYIGGGTGLFLNTLDYGEGSRFMIPLFVELKYSFLNRKVSPYVDFKTGMLGDLTKKGFGRIINPMAGVDIGRMSLGVGAQYMMCGYGNISLGNSGIIVGLSYNF